MLLWARADGGELTLYMTSIAYRTERMRSIVLCASTTVHDGRPKTQTFWLMCFSTSSTSSSGSNGLRK